MLIICKYDLIIFLYNVLATMRVTIYLRLLFKHLEWIAIQHGLIIKALKISVHTRKKIAFHVHIKRYGLAIKALFLIAKYVAPLKHQAYSYWISSKTNKYQNALHVGSKCHTWIMHNFEVVINQCTGSFDIDDVAELVLVLSLVLSVISTVVAVAFAKSVILFIQ